MTIEIDRYKLGERLGKGGFGEVFRACRTDLDRVDAIKVLHESHCRDAGAIARFTAEARAAGKIDHPGIVKVYDVGTLADGRTYCVMECLKGKTLRAVLDERGTIPIADAQPLLAKIAAAIDAAHAAGVAHRDLKPENVFVEPDGSIRVIDFGLAKLKGDADLTTTGAVMGSPRYMSPEQCRGKGADTRSDLYSFGALAYHLLTGKPPFEGDALALALHHLNDEPEKPSSRVPELSDKVDNILLSLLAKDAEKRPRPLQLAVAGLTTGEVPRSPQSSRRLVIGGVAAAAGIAVVVAMVLSSGEGGAPTPPPKKTVPALELIASFPIERADGPFLATDNTKLVNSHDDQNWEQIDYGKPDRPRKLVRWGQFAVLPDGRELAYERTGTIVLLGPGKQRVVVGTGNAPSLSPDAKQIAFFGAAGLRSYDIVSGKTRTISTTAAAASISWSPDGRKIATSLGNKPLVIDVASGAATQIEVPMAIDFGGDTVAFTDNDHILYCAREGERNSLRLRKVTAIGLGEMVRELDKRLADCSMWRSGNRISVGLVLGRREAAALDVAPRKVTALGAPYGLAPFEVFPDGRIANGYNTFDPSTKRTVVEPGCPNAPWLFRDGERLLDAAVSNEGAGYTLTFQTTDCRPVATWRLTEPPSAYQGPRCEAGLCVFPTLKNDRVTVWALERDQPARTLGSFNGPKTSSVMVQVAPDGKHVAAVTMENPAVWILSTDGKPPRKLDHIAYSAIWADADHLVLSPMIEDGRIKAIVYGLDGKREDLWNSPTRWFFGLSRSSGGTIFGDLKELSTEVLIYEVRT